MSKQSDVTGLFNEGFIVDRGFTVTPVLVANQNDYVPPAAPNAFADVYLLQFTLGANVTITGLAGGAHGRVIRVQNLSAFILTLSPQDAASAAPNRFMVPGGAPPVRITQFGWVDLYYTSARWQVVAASVPRDLQTTRRIAFGSTNCPTGAATVLATVTRLPGERVKAYVFPVEDNVALVWSEGQGGAVYVRYQRTAVANEFLVDVVNTSGVTTVFDWTIEGTIPTTP